MENEDRAVRSDRFGHIGKLPEDGASEDADWLADGEKILPTAPKTFYGPIPPDDLVNILTCQARRGQIPTRTEKSALLAQAMRKAKRE